jgi:hypothetical protein
MFDWANNAMPWITIFALVSSKCILVFNKYSLVFVGIVLNIHLISWTLERLILFNIFWLILKNYFLNFGHFTWQNTTAAQLTHVNYIAMESEENLLCHIYHTYTRKQVNHSYNIHKYVMIYTKGFCPFISEVVEHKKCLLSWLPLINNKHCHVLPWSWFISRN